ncbi:MAG: phospholipid/cholesterol/gamma-HCH transport system substrate-binding protein [Mycobacterium sp.]|jgi:phospholipid/cholesterol/gamma-HCH transport system substrate-binding protein|nr:phospholipid/cholesterol/gamma-HCH transport system substrate-binding protein [Mycobacterium sp.]MDT5289115.1 phospholipid/cholesterol/gamma-HCH transport system substrate-binding protein [Mycobacterium sp.]
MLVALIVGITTMTAMLFSGTLKSYVSVTLTSDRAGLVMESGGKVKMRGVQVGRVSQIVGGRNPVSLQLQIDPDQIKYIPANVQARIRATTAFGAKYVDLIYPSDPSTKRLTAGQTIKSENVSTEVNTVFQNLVGVLHQIDPAKLNAVLSALAEALRGQGRTIGEATTDANKVLMAINPRAETIRADWQSLKGFSDTYAAAAQDILKVLDAASTTSTTISSNAAALDALLTSVVGFSRSGVNLLGASKDNLVNAVNVIEPTTALLLKYNPMLTCMLVGSKWLLDNDGYAAAGGNGKSLIVDAAVLLGDDPYRYPDNLPIVGAKGGPGGKPSCGSLPIVDNNWPVRYLVTNTGFGTGLDVRPNPGIGFPGYANYFPGTRAVPEPPSIRNPGGPAPGPIPYPGAPPYGAQLYAPDGTPLYPGLPPAAPPGASREPGPPPPGSEPFVVPHPAQMQPIPLPPTPETAVPSP